MAKSICLECDKEMEEKAFSKHREKTGHVGRIDKEYALELANRWEKEEAEIEKQKQERSR